MRDARIDLLEEQIAQLRTEAVELKSCKVRLCDQIKSLTQERDSAIDTYKKDICNKLRLELESHVRNVGDIIAANLIESDEEDVVVDAAPTADAPEAAVAGPVSGASVESESESNSSNYSGSDAPEGK